MSHVRLTLYSLTIGGIFIFFFDCESKMAFYDSYPKFQNFCFCVNLRTGCITLGILSLLLRVLFYIVVKYHLFQYAFGKGSFFFMKYVKKLVKQNKNCRWRRCGCCGRCSWYPRQWSTWNRCRYSPVVGSISGLFPNFS